MQPTTPKSSACRADTVRYKLVVAFDGTRFDGWQAQKTGLGVQQVLESALSKLFKSHPRVCGSSRTDAGVHALGLVAHFDVPKAEARLEPRRLLLAINAWLPQDVRVLHVARAPAHFHARYGATRKQYRYFIWTGPAMNPLLRHYAWHVPGRLDLGRMREAAKYFLGTHDFRAFSANPGYPRRFTVRTVHRCNISQRGQLVTFVIEADGFLYKMCRGLVGTLVQVGQARFKPDDVKTMLASGDRRLAGMTAPAHGLVLWKVWYGRTDRHNPVDAQMLE